jgi:hypothetical protein
MRWSLLAWKERSLSLEKPLILSKVARDAGSRQIVCSCSEKKWGMVVVERMNMMAAQTYYIALRLEGQRWNFAWRVVEPGFVLKGNGSQGNH